MTFTLDQRRRRELWKDLIPPTLMYALFFAYWVVPGGLHFSDIRYEFMHFLPADSLRHRFWHSLFYLHGQPPLLNIFLGAAIKLGDLTPLDTQSWATIEMTLFSWLSCVGWHAIARRLLRSSVLASLMIALLLTNPGFALNQLIFYYPHMLMLEDALLVLAMIGYVKRPTTGRWCLVMLFYAVLVYTRSLWHPAFSFAMAGLVFVHGWLRTGRPGRALRQAVAGLAIFWALALPWMIKNQVLFNQFGFTTWLGFNIRNNAFGKSAIYEFGETGRYDPKILTDYYSPKQLERLQKDPDLTAIFKPMPPESDVKRMINYQHIAVPPLSRISVRETLAGYRRHPIAYVQLCIYNLFYSSLPAAYRMYTYDGNLHYKMFIEPTYSYIHDALYYGGWLLPYTRVWCVNAYIGFNLFVVLWLPLMLIGGLIRLRKLGRPRGAVWGMLLLLYGWMLTMIIFVDGAEGARMRWDLEPAFLIMTIQAVRELRGAIHRRLGRHSIPAEPPRAS